tara:strand:- start:62 stop:268 length:207 start_codon:yes stop_codon:yes gene_type:complete
MKINKDTNINNLSDIDLHKEAFRSQNRARVNLLQNIHLQREKQQSMETAYGYNPMNDMSFTGEFEAIS